MTSTIAQDLGGVVLLPCPFCGAEAAAESYVIEAAVFCTGCRAKIIRSHGARDDNGYPEAIAAWNTRTHSAEIAGALRDAGRWRAWRKLGEHEAADIAWLNAGEERDAALDAMQQGGGGGDHA